MTTPLDVRAAATAKRLINKFGTTVTYTHLVKGTYNPATSSMGSTTQVATFKATIGAPTDWDLKAMNRPSMNPDVPHTGMLDFNEVMYIAGSSISFVPAAADTVVQGGNTWTVRQVTAIYSGDNVALWIIGVKR
jgi:hypothetical protein